MAETPTALTFRALKHGGVLGVVEHRAKPGTDAKASAETGYVTEDVVVGFAKLAGFALDARSELNANRKDTTNHPGGVWALPPTLAKGQRGRRPRGAARHDAHRTHRAPPGS
jgi:predicted methyltransferase